MGNNLKLIPLNKIPDPEKIREIRLSNVIDMGLAFSAMIRLFPEGTKEKLHNRILDYVKRVSKAESKEDFDKIHSDFCEWGIREIRIAKKDTSASYGQIAKTFNVVLKVVIYYSHFPDFEKSKELSWWLHAAVDTEMMAMLRDYYPKDIKARRVVQVDKDAYQKLRETVAKFIKEKHNGKILPIQFDDIYYHEEKKENLND